MTRLEVRAGAHITDLADTQKLLSRFVNLDLTAAIADRAGEIISRSQQANQPVLVPDAIIAATAIIHNVTLVTFSAKDLEGITQLSLHPPSS